jgi:hypothetical protein
MVLAVEVEVVWWTLHLGWLSRQLTGKWRRQRARQPTRHCRQVALINNINIIIIATTWHCTGTTALPPP